MEPPLGRHQDILMAASSHSSQLEDMLVFGPKTTPQQEQRNINKNSNKMVGSKSSQPEQPLKCPRCDSTNTKFCYYNNYSLSQPRYFCKSCRRYWTKGGTLRNVPFGGGCRKNKRPSSSSSSSTSKRSGTHIDPHFSAVSCEANSVPLNNSFQMDIGLGQLGPKKNFDAPDNELPFMGSLGLHGTIGNPGASSSCINIPGFFDSIRGRLLHETHYHRSSFENFCHGLNSGAGEVQGQCQETRGRVPKQEITSGFESENRVLWGYPRNGSSNEVDSARSLGSWNGIINTATTNWHGLVDSPLM